MGTSLKCPFDAAEDQYPVRTSPCCSFGICLATFLVLQTFQQRGNIVSEMSDTLCALQHGGQRWCLLQRADINERDVW